MKKFAKLLCLILALCMVVSLCACGEKSRKDDDEDEEESIAGTYVLTGLEEDGETLDAEEMGMAGITLVINEDGTAEMGMGGYTQELVWEDGEIWAPEEEEPEKVKMTVKGNKITLENDGQKMIFTKQKSDKNSGISDDPGPGIQQPVEEAVSLYGTYYFSYMEEDDFKATAADMEAGGMDPNTMYVTIYEDGTGILSMYGETMDMEWGNGEIWPVDEPDEPVNLSFDGFTLTMEQDGQKIVFEK